MLHRNKQILLLAVLANSFILASGEEEPFTSSIQFKREDNALKIVVNQACINPELAENSTALFGKIVNYALLTGGKVAIPSLVVQGINFSENYSGFVALGVSKTVPPLLLATIRAYKETETPDTLIKHRTYGASVRPETDLSKASITTDQTNKQIIITIPYSNDIAIPITVSQ